MKFCCNDPDDFYNFLFYLDYTNRIFFFLQIEAFVNVQIK